MAYYEPNNRNYDGNITLPTKIGLGLWVVLTCWFSFAGHAQSRIELEFSQIQLREEFSDKNENWPYLTTMEN